MKNFSTAEWIEDYLKTNDRFKCVYESLSEFDQFWIDAALMDMRHDACTHGINLMFEDLRKRENDER